QEVGVLVGMDYLEASADHIGSTVAVGGECRVPERFWVMLVAHEEEGVGEPIVDGEREGEGDVRRVAGGGAPGAFEVEGRKVTDAPTRVLRRVRCRIGAVEGEHGHALAFGQIRPDVFAEAER